jgi:hypothetical protein
VAGATVVVATAAAGGAALLATDCSMTTRGAGLLVNWNEITCAAAAAPVPTHRVVAIAAATVLRGSMGTRVRSGSLRWRKVPSKTLAARIS